MNIANRVAAPSTAEPRSAASGDKQFGSDSQPSDAFGMLLQQTVDQEEANSLVVLPGCPWQKDEQAMAEKGQELAAQMLTEFLFGQQMPAELLPEGQLTPPPLGTTAGGQLVPLGLDSMEKSPGVELPEQEVTFQQMAQSPMGTEVLGQGRAVSEEKGIPKALAGNGDFMACVAEVRKHLTQKEEQMDPTPLAAQLQQLQQVADSGRYLPPVSGSQDYQEALTNASIVQQATTAIRSGLDLGKEQFVVKLKPEGLGEITVKLRESEGKILMSITATTAQAVKALNGGAAQLQEALRPHNTQLCEVIQETASYVNAGQNFGQNFGEHQHQQPSHQGPSVWREEKLEEVLTEENGWFSHGLESALDAYI